MTGEVVGVDWPTDTSISKLVSIPVVVGMDIFVVCPANLTDPFIHSLKAEEQ